MRLAWPTLLTLFLVAPERAWAQDVLEVELTPIAQIGEGQPSLTIRARAKLDQINLELSGGGHRFKRSAGPVVAGRSHTFTLPLPSPQQVRLEGQLEVRRGDEGGTMPLSFDVELRAPIELRVPPEDVDLEARQLRLSASRPLHRVKVAVRSEEGAPIGASEGPARVEADGRVLVKWSQPEPGRVLRIDVTGFDAEGFFGRVSLFPWQVQIPHEDVRFASGEAAIPASEEGKMKESLRLLKAALDKYGKLAEGLSLFVAGHTDTVGPGESNRALSERRAQALARWFAGRGVGVPIRYVGLGESELLVRTPDEVDEARNRRAEYIVAIEAPRFGGRAPPWRKLTPR